MIKYADRSSLYQVYSYSTNVIQTLGERPWREPTDGQVPLYGVELEVSTDYSASHIIDAFPDIFALCKQDSSISGAKQNKMEIVTIPAPVRKHKKMWASFFKNLNEDMFDLLDKHTNGMHVHIGRDAFDKDMIHLKKFCWFFSNPANYQFLSEISERDKSSMDSYSSVPKTKSVATAERSAQSAGKHTIINLGHSATVEVRMFKGIVSFASIVKNLEFVDSVVHFTGISSMKDINIAKYLDFLNALPRSHYRTLRMCVEDMDLKSMILISRYQTILASLSAKKVGEVLNSGVLEITDSKLTKKIITLFNDKFQSNGYKLTGNPNSGWVVERIGTKFAKFNDKTLAMYSFSR